MAKKIIVATGNTGKMTEIAEIMEGLSVELVSMREYWKASVDIEENGSSFAENAAIKADWVFKHSNGEWALADDSGLMVDALDGAPGIKSARFAGTHGDTASNNAKLLGLLEGVSETTRTARFVCAVALRITHDTLLTAEGVCEGKIISVYRGTEGFGYDPLFIPDGYNQTFAELSSDSKNSISHRGRALKKIKEQLDEFI